MVWSVVVLLSRMHRGHTLIELLIVLLLVGMLMALALPPVAAWRDRLAVDQAARLIVAAHTRARLVAATERRAMQLDLSAESLVLRPRAGAADSGERWRHPGPASSGVTVAGMPHQVLVAPSGLPFGLANNSYTLTRGAARRQVVVSRYGRVLLR
jgi:prepilin-type N-terminal cleavage/methylation domain-containing protein